MLLRKEDDGTHIAIGQASHAWISGQLARAWGNPAFPPPARPEETFLAAEQHDVGWALWDLEPDLNPQTGLPTTFIELPRAQHVALWTQAPLHLITQSAYAALLVSLHGTSRYERFVDVDALPGDEAGIVRAYLAGQHELQARLATAAGAAWDELRVQQRLLAAWDTLSLALCLRWPPVEIRDVPGTSGPATLELAPDGEGFTLDPWPLAVDRVELRCEGRRLAGTFADAAAMQRALEVAPLEEVVFGLHPARR